VFYLTVLLQEMIPCEQGNSINSFCF